LDHPWFAGVLLLQLALVTWGLRAYRLRVPQGPWRHAVVPGLFVLSAATVSRSLGQTAFEIGFGVLVQLIAIANVALICHDAPVELFRRMGAVLLPNAARLAAIFVLGASIALSLVAYQRHPHISDEVTYMLHSRYFAAGMIAMPAPPSAAAFELDLMTYEPARWFSPVTPGWPAILAIGQLLKAPWLVNPVLAAVNLVLAFALLRGFYGREFAQQSALLLAASPWFLFMGMNFMPHMAALACFLAASLALTRAMQRGSLTPALIAGAALGVLSLIRPLDAVVSLVPLAFLALYQRIRLVQAISFVCASAAIALLSLPYNRALTGRPAYFPLMQYFDRYYWPGADSLGFGPNRGLNWPIDPKPGHDLVDAAVNSALNLSTLNGELFGWATGSLALVALGFAGRRLARPDWFMLLTGASVVAAYSFYWFSGGPDFGPRYWFLMVVPAVVFAVHGIGVLTSHLGPRGAIAAPMLVVASLLVFVPWRVVDKYRGYLRMQPDAPRLARELRFGRSLVFIRGERFPDYASAATYNPLDLRAAAPVYAWFKNETALREAIAAYPDRPVYILDGPSRTRSGFRLAAGPVAGTELLARVPE
jgi:hypothetical protein